MNLKDYFKTKNGNGVLATANSDGKVNVAVYAKPFVENDSTIAFVTTNRLTYANLQSNPQAAYLFLESGGVYGGKRLFLTKIQELKGEDVTQPELKERYEKAVKTYKNEQFTVVFFRVNEIRQLIG